MTGEEIAVALARQDNELADIKVRVRDCEEQQKTIHEIALSVNKLAVNMESMLTEQKEMGRRIGALEQQPAERLSRLRDAVIKCVISSVLGALLGALMALVLR